MFSLNEGNRFVVCLQGVDLRKGLDSLCGLIRYLSLSPTNGDVYVFLNKSRTTMKLLHWERGGFAQIGARLKVALRLRMFLLRASLGVTPSIMYHNLPPFKAIIKQLIG